MKLPSRKIVIPLLAVTLLVWLFRATLREQIRDHATLANDAPPADVVSDMIEQAADPHAALLAAWNSGKIVHRAVAIREIGWLYPRPRPLPADCENIVYSGALDPDMDVREAAFATLDDRNDPALAGLAAKQLKDADPSARLLGVTQLKRVSANLVVPLAAGLLNDPDLRVVGMSLKLLEHWSGENFGARLSDTVPVEDPQTGLIEFPDKGTAKTRTAADLAWAWWTAHQNEFPAVQPQLPDADQARWRLPAGDFQLRTLDGRAVRLSDFRGKVVVINFWATWCTACISELPELITLQKQHDGQLIILGVCMDFVPEEDGDPQAEPGTIRPKIARTIQSLGINYPILLDEHNEVGIRFNGGELPTTVIVDADGNIRRRFVGARDLQVFEAMITEASRPATLAVAH